MQLIYDEGTQSIWMFATPDELLEIASSAQQRSTEAILGDSLTVFNMGIDKSELIFRISVDQDKRKSDRQS